MQFYGFISINPRFYRFINGQMLTKSLLVAKAQYSARFSQNSPISEKRECWQIPSLRYLGLYRFDHRYQGAVNRELYWSLLRFIRVGFTGHVGVNSPHNNEQDRIDHDWTNECAKYCTQPLRPAYRRLITTQVKRATLNPVLNGVLHYFVFLK